MKKKNHFAVLLALFFSSCTGDGTFRDVQGVVKSASPSTFNVPGSPVPTISILGRNSDEFLVEFTEETLNTPLANFVIRGVPKNKLITFEIQHPSFDPIISFPYDISKTSSITLPALEAGTVAQIIAQIENLSGQTVTPTAGMILGQLASEGSSGGGCSPLTSVAIRSKESGQPIAVLGPYYFSPSGNVVNTGSFNDSQCNYVMANVLPGVYILDFLDNASNKQTEYEVIALGGNVSFGVDVP